MRCALDRILSSKSKYPLTYELFTQQSTENVPSLNNDNTEKYAGCEIFSNKAIVGTACNSRQTDSKLATHSNENTLTHTHIDKLNTTAFLPTLVLPMPLQETIYSKSPKYIYTS